MPFSHEIGFIVFRIAIPALLLGIQLFLYLRTTRWLKEAFPHNRWKFRVAASLFVVMNLPLLYVAIARPRVGEFPQWFLYLAAYPFFIWHGATLFIGLVLIVSSLLKLPVMLVGSGFKLIPPVRKSVEIIRADAHFQRFDASRRVFLRRSMYGLTALSFGSTAYGMLVGKKDYEVTDAVFPIRNLHPSLHGFTIALISDIHSSYNMLREEMEEYARVVNSLGCDMILVTGDFVNSMTEEVYPFAEAFSALHAPQGVYGVMGNHDFFAREPEIVAREVDACGIKLLRNDKVVIAKDGGSFYLLGVDDVGNPRRAQEKFAIALGSPPLNIPKLLMVHRPYFLQQASEANIDLVLSGHTHGGQVVLATVGNVVIAPASIASKYVWGKYAMRNTQMYVNRGIGTVGLPIRLNCPPEITRITLVAQSDRPR